MTEIDFGTLFAQRFPHAPPAELERAREVGTVDGSGWDSGRYETACRLYLKQLPQQELEQLVPVASRDRAYVDLDALNRHDVLQSWGFFRVMRYGETIRRHFSVIGGPFPTAGYFLAAVEWQLLAREGVVPGEVADRYSEFVERVIFAQADQEEGVADASPRMWVELGKFQYENPFDIFEHRYAGAFETYDCLDELFARQMLSREEWEAYRRLQALWPGQFLLSYGETVRYAIDYIHAQGRAAHIVADWLRRDMERRYGEKGCDEPAFFRKVSSFRFMDTASFSDGGRPCKDTAAGEELPLCLVDSRGMPFEPRAQVRQICRYEDWDEVRATAWYRNAMWLLRIFLHHKNRAEDRVILYILSTRESSYGHEIAFLIRAADYPHDLQRIQTGEEYAVCLIDLWGRDVPLRVQVERKYTNSFAVRAVFPDGILRDFFIDFPRGSTSPAQDVARMEKNRRYWDIPYPDWKDYVDDWQPSL